MPTRIGVDGTNRHVPAQPITATSTVWSMPTRTDVSWTSGRERMPYREDTLISCATCVASDARSALAFFHCAIRRFFILLSGSSDHINFQSAPLLNFSVTERSLIRFPSFLVFLLLALVFFSSTDRGGQVETHRRVSENCMPKKSRGRCKRTTHGRSIERKKKSREYVARLGGKRKKRMTARILTQSRRRRRSMIRKRKKKSADRKKKPGDRVAFHFFSGPPT